MRLSLRWVNCHQSARWLLSFFLNVIHRRSPSWKFRHWKAGSSTPEASPLPYLLAIVADMFLLSPGLLETVDGFTNTSRYEAE